MQQSAGVREAILRCYEVFSTGDLESSMRLLTQEGLALGIGTDPEEWANTRAEFAALLQGWMTEPRVVVRLEAGEDPRCFEEGSVGWVVDRPTFALADGGSVSARMTAVMRQEAGEWKLIHAHWSVGVPNQEAFAK